MEWIDAKDRLPELPELPDGRKYCSVEVIAHPKGWANAVGMEYERALVHGKRVERWLWCGRIFHGEVEHWRPFPPPPEKEGLKK